MKKLLCILIALTMLSGLSAAAEGMFTPGTYEAEAQGLFVPVKVTVTVSETEITDIQINAEGETPAVGGAASAPGSSSGSIVSIIRSDSMIAANRLSVIRFVLLVRICPKLLVQKQKGAAKKPRPAKPSKGSRWQSTSGTNIVSEQNASRPSLSSPYTNCRPK